jgi:hypothetical protein
MPDFRSVITEGLRGNLKQRGGWRFELDGVEGMPLSPGGIDRSVIAA